MASSTPSAAHANSGHGSLAAARQISGTPPTATSQVNSPKTTVKLKNGPNNNNNTVAPNNRLRSKESSPELVNGRVSGPVVVEVPLEKRILDAIALLSQNKYNVLDEGQQREAVERVQRMAVVEGELQVQTKGVQALGVLVNYLVNDVSTNLFRRFRYLHKNWKGSKVLLPRLALLLALISD